MRSKLKKLPVIKISDINVESLVSGSIIPKRVRFALAHPDKCCTGTFQSLAEIDAYCSNKVLTAKRKDYYDGWEQRYRSEYPEKGFGQLFLIHLNWVLNTGSHAVEYESRKGPYLVLMSMNRSYREVHDNIIEHPMELVLRTGESIWQVYSFYVEGLPNIEEDPICKDFL